MASNLSPSPQAARAEEPAGGVTSVLLAVETAFYREGLTRLLAGADGIEVAGVRGSRDDALRAASEEGPHVVLIDLELEEGLALVADLAVACPGTRIVPLVGREREEDVIAWAEAGIAGYVTRDTSFDQLLAVISRAASGEAECSPRVAGALLRRISALAGSRGTTAPALDRLTRRELEVAYLMEEGLSNKEIATRLHVELGTVKNHVHSVLEKLDVRRRAEVGAHVRRSAPSAVRRSYQPARVAQI